MKLLLIIWIIDNFAMSDSQVPIEGRLLEIIDEDWRKVRLDVLDLCFINITSAL